MNLFQSLFKRNAALNPPAASVTPSSTALRYAYAFQSPYRQPRILILVDNIRATYFLSFHYVLERLHKSESLAFFVLDSAEVERWTNDQSASQPLAQSLGQVHSPADEDFVRQVIKDVQPTLVIFSRYGLPYGDTLPDLFRQKKIATVCHIDDDLLNINPDLGEEIQKRQGDPIVQKARRILLEETDLIYASTAFLGDRFAHQFPQQKVFYGMYAPYLDFLLTRDSLHGRPEQSPEQSPAQSPAQLTIGYMGSKGHQEDLNAIADDIGRILTHYPQTRFEIFGTIQLPPALESFQTAAQDSPQPELCPRIQTYSANTDYAGFLNKLQQLNWDIGLAPLKDTEFNRCKAPTKYIEYTTCGIPTIASDGAAYSQFSANEQILIAQPNQWFNKIQQLIENPALRKTLVANSQTYCAQNFSLDILENQLKELLALL